MFILFRTEKKYNLLTVLILVSLFVLSFSFSPDQLKKIKTSVVSGKKILSNKINKTAVVSNEVTRFSKVNFMATKRDSFNCNDTALNKKIVIVTTIDSLLQHYANMILMRYHPVYGSIVVVNAKTGELLTVSNYINPDSTNLPVMDSLLFLNSKFPCASTFKTITLYSTLNNLYSSLDQTINFNGRSTTLYRRQLKETNNMWTRNFTLANAYAKSANPVFGKLGMRLGIKKLKATSQKFLFGCNIPFYFKVGKSQIKVPEKEYNLAEIGSGFTQDNRMSPLHGALLFSPIANKKAYFPRPVLFKKIIYDGDVVYNGLDSIKPIKYIKKSLCEKLETAGCGVVEKGTARGKTKMMKKYIRLYDNDWVFGGKTGTLDSDYLNGRTDWFVGFLYNKKTGESYSFSTVQIHGAYWNKHSSFIASECMKWYIREKKKIKKIRLEQLVRDSIFKSDSLAKQGAKLVKSR